MTGRGFPSKFIRYLYGLRGRWEQSDKINTYVLPWIKVQSERYQLRQTKGSQIERQRVGKNQARLGGKNLASHWISVNFFVIVFALLSISCGLSSGDRPTPVPRIIKTEKESITVPGEAFIDGTNPEPPDVFTLLNVNAWDRNEDVILCRLRHNDKVRVLAVKDWGSGIYSFEVESILGDCAGWVSDLFLSNELHKIVGETIP